MRKPDACRHSDAGTGDFSGTDGAVRRERIADGPGRGNSCYGPRRRGSRPADGNAHRGAHDHPDANSCTYPGSDADTGYHAPADRFSGADRNGFADAGTDRDPHTGTDANSESYAGAHSDPHTGTNAGTDANACARRRGAP
jgi:hypothetical protein